MSVHSGLRKIAYLLCAVVLCTAYSGCAQHQGGRNYTAANLPSSLRYRSRTNPRELSLANFASLPKYGNAIGPGDFIEVSIAAGLNREQVLPPLNVQVTDNGTIKLPELGQIDIAGMKPDSAGTAIQNELVAKEKYVNPLVTVQVKEKQKNTVRVVGGVQKEGLYELPADQSDVLTAIAMAGGLSDMAGDRVQVRSARGTIGMESEYASSGGVIQQAGYRKQIGGASFAMAPVTISLAALAQGGGVADPESVKLGDGAVVMVQESDPIPITVRGLVNKPGPIEPTGNNVRVLDALGQAGDVSNQFANKIRVIRAAKQGDPINIFIKLTDAKVSEQSNILLAPGDIVSVEQTPGTITLDALRIIRFGVSSRLDQLL
ncbi:MAG: polysaccharide biosynthesis/export family protein [Planctomycetaceae bacterium]